MEGEYIRFWFMKAIKMPGKSATDTIKGNRCMRRGSVTVEAAIALPVFLCMIISIVFIIKLVYTHELIQHALIETADEMASTSYIYHVSGIQDINDSLREGMQGRAQIFKDQLSTVFDTYISINNLEGSKAGIPGNLEETADLINNARENFDRMVDSANSTASSPLDELKNIACLIASGAFSDIKTELFTPVTRLYMKKYLTTEAITDVDLRLKGLNIHNGFKGLDFTESSFLDNADENIDIIVRYSIRLPVPIKILPELVIVQRASARAWTGGDEASGIVEDNDELWSLDNFKRGSRIRTIFGANLPFSFPVIAKFEAGTTVMIKSMDLTAQSYQDSGTLMETLDEYISNLAGYKGQEQPWGSKGIVIKKEDIKKKELVLVIPKNTLPEQIEHILENYKGKAAASGISLRIERYGIKTIIEKTENSDTHN
jgi:hypothetical protein